MIETNQKDHSVRLVMEGNLDAEEVDALRPRLLNLVAEGFCHFRIDFKKSAFMCSSGLGLLVEVHNAVASKKGGVTVENLTPPLQKLLTDTKLMSIFKAPDGPASDRLEALQEVQKHMSQELLFLSHLNTVSSSILQADITEEIYDVTLEGVMSSLKSPQGMQILIDEGPKGSIFRVAAAEGFTSDVCEKVSGLALKEGTFESECLKSGEAKFFSAASNDPPPFSPLLKATGAMEGILAPIVGRGNPLGLILITASENVSTFFPHSIPLLQVFSNVCGLAIEKQSLLEDIQYKNAQLAKTLNTLNKTQASLMEAGKLAVIGAMMRGLAHALNNKLVPIMGYSQILAGQLKDDAAMSEKVEVIETAAIDIKRIVDNLRTMVIRKELNIEIHDLREVIDSAIFILDYLFRDYRIQVERAYGDLDARMDMDRERLVQVFLALFHRLPLAFEEQSDRLVLIEIERGEEDMIVRVTDNGHGIPEEDLGSILNPFDGFHGPFANDRLNFSIANGVLKDHRGSIDVIPREPNGVQAVVRIPLKQKPSKGAQLIG